MVAPPRQVLMPRFAPATGITSRKLRLASGVGVRSAICDIPQQLGYIRSIKCSEFRDQLMQLSLSGDSHAHGLDAARQLIAEAIEQKFILQFDCPGLNGREPFDVNRIGGNTGARLQFRYVSLPLRAALDRALAIGRPVQSLPAPAVQDRRAGTRSPPICSLEGS